jgi:leukotriene-A4 hydrolase
VTGDFYTTGSLIMFHRVSIIGLVLTAFSLCPAVAHASVDVHTFSEPGAVRSTHLELDLTVDFEASRISGTVVHHLERTDPSARHFIVDTNGLTIDGTSALVDGTWVEVVADLSAADPLMGRALRIDLPDGASQVRIQYRTQDGAAGLQWLNSRQTAGGDHPFMFSMGEPIFTRTWIPLQDTPAVRITYEAVVHVPRGLVAVMASEQLTEGRPPVDGGLDSFRFQMPQAIPSYLIALAVGDLEFRAMSARTGIWTEPSLLDASAWEFADTEAMIATVERMYGDYDWGRYDLLVLPPSFPIGGMENPRLSFITPTVLAGDRSLVSLIAHELAHSWSGNLITNASWRDLWLNEGFTSYLEIRIMEELYGADRATQEYLLSVESLDEELPGLVPELQWLSPEVDPSFDPDALFTGIPYTKGMMMLAWLERRVGREQFDAFLSLYFTTFSFQSMDSETFLAFVDEELLRDSPVSRAEVEAWVYGPGIPADAYRPESDAFEHVARLRSEFVAGILSPRDMAVNDWTVHQWLFLIETMPSDLGALRMAELDEAFEFTTQGNNEIVAAWLELAIQQSYRPADQRLERFLTSVGRNKYLGPLYRALVATPDGLATARRVFEQARPGYHPQTVSMVESILATVQDGQG